MTNPKSKISEDGLKLLNVEYLSNYWSDLSQILNLSLGDLIFISLIWIYFALLSFISFVKEYIWVNCATWKSIV